MSETELGRVFADGVKLFGEEGGYVPHNVVVVRVSTETEDTDVAIFLVVDGKELGWVSAKSLVAAALLTRAVSEG